MWLRNKGKIKWLVVTKAHYLTIELNLYDKVNNDKMKNY